MKLFDVALRNWSPKRYFYWRLKQQEDANKARLKAERSLPPIELQNLKAELDHELWDWINAVREIEDKELVREALKMDIYLDQIPRPSASYPYDDPSGYYTFAGTGCRLLRDETRTELVARIRERTPAYRKERKEVIELYIKIAATLVTLITGLLGAATGLVALLKK